VALGAVTENCAASAPVMANGGVSVTGAVLRLPMVIVADADAPSATEPKSCGAGVALMRPGVGALLRSADRS